MKEEELKAKELIERFLALDMIDRDGYTYWIEDRNAKQCALIHVDGMISEVSDAFGYTNNGQTNIRRHLNERIEFWQEVKQILTDKY